jgi:hypothetical protein
MFHKLIGLPQGERVNGCFSSGQLNYWNESKDSRQTDKRAIA